MAGTGTLKKFNFYWWTSTAILICSILAGADAWVPRSYPQVGISEWMSVDEDYEGVWQNEDMVEDGVKVKDQGNTYIVSSKLFGLSIECNASYPLQWTFQNAEDAGEDIYSIKIRTIRRAKDVFNSRTNKFTSVLELYGQKNTLTGNYSCYSIEYPVIRKDIHVYWEGLSPPYLIHSGETLQSFSKDNKTLVLPCRVSKPDVKVKLFKEDHVNFKEESLDSPFIHFNPRIGFTLDITQMNDPFGRYKCSTDEMESPMIVDALKVPLEDIYPPFPEILHGNASFAYDDSKNLIVCCSNSSKPPMLRQLYCFDSISCELRAHLLKKIANNGHKKGGCRFIKVYSRDSGILRCHGDGIDVFRRFFTSVKPPSTAISANSSKSSKLNVYFHWNEIVPEKMMKIHAGTFSKNLYDLQNVTFMCDTAFFYFAEGIQWAVRWNNGSLIFLKDNSVDRALVNEKFQNVRIQLKKNMTELYCFAPVWNSTEWVNHTYQLHVKETAPPKFFGMDKEIVYLKLNSTDHNLVCNCTGSPIPRLRWRRNNKTILLESNMSVQKFKNECSIVLRIHRVSHESHGLYECRAINFGGAASKRYMVFVYDGNGMGSVTIFFLTITVLSLLGGLIFLGWKLNLQKKVISHLSTIAFKDVTNSS